MTEYNGDELSFLVDDILKHHGILGQKWGERRGPPYPIENKAKPARTKLGSESLTTKPKKKPTKDDLIDPVNSTVIKKGKKLGHITSVPKLEKGKGQMLYVFDQDSPEDTKQYRGEFSYFLGTEVAWVDKLYEHSFEPVRDLKMPTQKQRIDAFIKQYNDKPVDMIRDLKAEQAIYQKNRKAYPKDSFPEVWVNVKKLKTKEDWNNAYKIFNRNIGKSKNNRSESAKWYIEAMSKKYDAMIDDNDAFDSGLSNKPRSPLIIFKPDEVLKEVGNVKVTNIDDWDMIDYMDMPDYLEYFNRERQKGGNK